MRSIPAVQTSGGLIGKSHKNRAMRGEAQRDEKQMKAIKIHVIIQDERQYQINEQGQHMLEAGGDYETSIILMRFRSTLILVRRPHITWIVRESSSAREHEREEVCVFVCQMVVSQRHPFASSRPICDSGREVPDLAGPEDL